jgi:HD-GYP domain-containing protein (c-di-GMP phosphodiesterase class II)
MLARVRDSEIDRWVRYHHERLDGQGYPDRLPAEKIPLGARILAVADAFEAMISARPYRPPQSVKQAIAELRHCARSQFDPVVVEALVVAVETGRTVAADEVAA